MTSYGDEHLAVEILKSGAIDYFGKSPAAFRDLPATAARALHEWENIHARRMAEIHERIAQKRLADVLAFLPDPVLATDPEGRVIVWNQAIEKMTGFPAVEMIGRGNYEYSIPFYGERRPILIDLVLKDDAEARKKYDYIQRDGDRITSETYTASLYGGRGAYLWGVASPLYDTAGNRTGAIEVIRDISDRRKTELDLKAAQKSLDEAHRIARIGVWDWVAETGVITWSKELCRIVGWDPAVPPPSFDELERFYTPEGWKSLKEASDRSRTTGEPYSLELELIRTDGSRRWQLVTGSTEYDNSGKMIGLHGTVQDITERKNAELAVSTSERKYRYLVENVHDIIWQTDRELLFTYVSPAVMPVFGRSAGDLIGKSLFSILTGPSAAVVQERLRERLRQYREGERDLSTIFEIEAVRDDGTNIWLEVSSSPVYGPEGELAGFHGISRDISARRLAEEALRASEMKYRTLVENSGTGIVIIDREGKYLFINKRAAAHMGALPDQIIGKSMSDFLPEETARLYLERNRELMDSGSGREYEDTFETKTGTKSFYIVDQCLRDNEDRCYALQSSSVDITERKQVEEALKASEKKYRLLFESAPIGITHFDRKGVVTDCNENLAAIIGAPREKLIGVDMPVAFVNEKQKTALSEALAGRIGHFEGEYRSVTSGKTTMIRTIYAPILDEHGSVAGGIGITEDVSKRRIAEAALRESEERFREIFNNANDGIELIALGPDGSPGRFIDVNEVSCRMVQYTREELLAMTPFDIDSGDFSRPFDEIMKEIGDVGHATFETGHRRKDGTVLPVEINTHRITIQGTEVLLSVIRDISERKRAEGELIRKKEEAERYLDLATVMFIALDREGRIILANRRAEELLGCPRSRMLGTVWFDRFIPERAREKVRAIHARLIAGEIGPAGYAEDYILTRSGGERLIAWHNTVIQDEDGRISATLSSGEDITSSRKAETALRESEERYRSLVEEMPDLVIVHRQGELLFLNASITRLLGKPAETLLHTSIMNFIAPESRETIVSAMEKRERGGAVAPYIARIILPDGSTRWVEIRGAPIIFDGEPATFNVLTDITEKKWAEEALYESERKFRTVADYTYDWEYWAGKDGDFIYVSPSCERISGYQPEEFYRNKDLLRQIILPEDLTVFDTHEETLGQMPDPKQIEFRIRAKDGRILWIGHICQPVFSPDGEFLGHRGSNRDITLRRQAEDALKASEVRFRSLIQNSSDIIRILSRDRKITYESSSSERILGYPPGFFIGKDPRDLIHPDDRDRVKAEFQEVLDKTNTGIPTEFRILKADGSYLWVNAIGTNLLGVTGVDGIVITIRPIEQRKQMENELKENQIRLATAMDMAHLANWEFDIKTGIFTFNDRFYALYGTTAEQEGGYLMPAETYVREFVHPEDRAYATDVIGDVASVTDPEYTAELEHRIIRRNGEMRYVVVRFGVIMGADGKVVRTRGANQDITDQKLMESEIRALNRALEQRVVQRTEELNKSLQEKELLLREIHHRVKNNLQIIISILRLQKRAITDPGTLAALMDGESRVRSMALVHEKLYRSKDLEHIDIGDYLKALTQYLFTTYLVEQRRISFNVAMSDISLDIQRAIPIGLILNELISNALKHAFPPGRDGEVRIMGKKEKDQILIFIEDNGVGFPEGLDWRHTQSLGMHLVMTLIEQVQGTIDLSTGSGGSRFTIAIPLRGGKGP